MPPTFTDRVYEEYRQAVVDAIGERLPTDLAKIARDYVCPPNDAVVQGSEVRNRGSLRYHIAPDHMLHASCKGVRVTMVPSEQTGELWVDGCTSTWHIHWLRFDEALIDVYIKMMRPGIHPAMTIQLAKALCADYVKEVMHAPHVHATV